MAAKTTSDASKTTPFPPDPNSQQSTVSTVAREIREAGGDATPVAVDVRHQDSVERLIQQTIEVSPNPCLHLVAHQTPKRRY